ncbi:hypothetical protein KFE25_003730 [Diacronema lutheri]|uniref:Ion transport domain-containing protein n=2 Tax=Diacronema lutheri TaxID=2081491 RepID=A0A8J5X3Q7_DIALT|nr:hypothetical protein KFE25_003730 [Diacronema lutheri]
MPAPVAPRLVHRLLSTSSALRRARSEGYDARGSPPQLRGEPGEVYVALRPAVHDLDQAEGVKGFVLFALYFSAYFVLQAVRIDAAWGRSTLQWFEEARRGDVVTDVPPVSALLEPSCGWRGVSRDGEPCFWPFEHLTRVSQVVDFVGAGIPQLLTAMRIACPRCDLALTQSAADMERLNLTDFVCSDFSSESGTDAYPTRACAVENARWAAAPSTSSAPCCDDARLVRFSLELMGAAAMGDRPEAPRDAERARAGARAFVESAIDGGYVVQLIVSRAQRMVGIEHHARWVSKEWSPDRVVTRLAYWSYRYDDWRTQAQLARLTTALALLCVTHELIRLWAHNPSKRALLRRLGSSYWLLLTVPSFALPALAELTQRPISVSSYTLWVSANELLMFVRCFHEGHVLPPFKVIVLTLANAAGQLLSFSIAMLCAIAVLAAVFVQLFGAWHPAYASFGMAFTRVFTSFTVGAEVDEDAMRVSPAGAALAHYVTNLFLFLIVSQFFIAIVVGSFDATREVERELRRYREIPSGYAPFGSPGPTPRRLADALGYLCAYRAHGGWAPLVVRGLERAIRRAERLSFDAGIDCPGMHPVMLTLPELVAAVGADSARSIAARYAVVRVKPDDGDNDPPRRARGPSFEPRPQRGTSTDSAGGDVDARPPPAASILSCVGEFLSGAQPLGDGAPRAKCQPTPPAALPYGLARAVRARPAPTQPAACDGASGAGPGVAAARPWCAAGAWAAPEPSSPRHHAHALGRWTGRV